MCCNGALFSRMNITAEEKNVMGSSGRYGTTKDGSHLLLLGCKALSDKGCTAYDIRPRGCRTFRCELLMKVEGNSLSADQAMFFVDQLEIRRKQLRDLCCAIMPETDWPLELVGTARVLAAKMNEYEQHHRKLSDFEVQQIMIARATYIAFVRTSIDKRFMNNVVLDESRARLEDLARKKGEAAASDDSASMPV